MNQIFKWCLWMALCLMLSACITDYTPKETIVELQPGEAKEFTAISDIDCANLNWYLDGEKVAGDQTSFTYDAEDNTSCEEAIYHKLEVREEACREARLQMHKGRHKNIVPSVVWILKVQPECGEVVCYMDTDGDGFGDPDNAVNGGDPPVNCVDDKTDCDDNDAGIYPGATEVECDGIDQDCDGEDACPSVDNDNDGVTQDADCDDDDASIYPGATEVECDGIDQDCDGADYCPVVDSDGDGSAEGTDCNDNDASIYPGATEVQCDGIDQDCDGADDCPAVDNDGDGSAEGADCNDNDASIHPGASEVACDGIDQNCDGEDYCPVVDKDGDGSAEGADCNDNDASIYPGAAEVNCDGIDQDCDGADYCPVVDNDGDGSPEGADCNDNDASIYPGATEVACDGIDQDCSGGDYCVDADGDAFADGVDCNDNDPSIHPGARELECDGIDQNCDGKDYCTVVVDADGDGSAEGEDCNDNDASIYPDADEVECDGIDQNCDGEDFCPVVDADGDGSAEGEDCNDNDASIYPGATEVECDGIDQDCDGADACSVVDADGDGSVEDEDCNDNDASIYPGATEVECDGIDQDCDGSDLCSGPLGTPGNVQATDLDAGRTDIQVTWDAVSGADHYNVYRSIFDASGNYEIVGEEITGTSFTFTQTWEDDVYPVIGDTPGLAGEPSDADKLAFINALNAYREMALPVLFDFKAPAYFKVEACDADGCSNLSAADQGRANYIHTQDYSEVAMHVIPTWGYAQLIALADAPSKAQGLDWCGIDLCGSGGGIVMGRVGLDIANVNVDVVYEDFTETLEGVNGAYVVMNGSLGGQMDMGMAFLGHFWLTGDFDIDMSGITIGLGMYAEIGGQDGEGVFYHDGYANITYNGETYQFSLPIQAADDITGHAATPIEAIVPARTDTGSWKASTGANPVSLSEEAPANGCLRNWTEYAIETCTESLAP